MSTLVSCVRAGIRHEEFTLDTSRNVIDLFAVAFALCSAIVEKLFLQKMP